MLMNSTNFHESHHSYVSQIIYPVNELLRCKTHAYLIGWNLENFRCCIACVIEVPKNKYDSLNEILEKCREMYMSIFSSCSKDGSASPLILGEWIPNITSDYIPDVNRRMGGIWITLTTNPINTSMIKFHSLYSLGMSYNTSCYLFQYETVNTDRLNCLHIEEQFDNLNSSITTKGSTALKKSELDLILAQINCAHELNNSIQQLLSLSTGNESTSVPSRRNLLPFYESSTVGGLIALISMMGSAVLMGPTWLWHAVLYKFNKLLRRKFIMFSFGSLFANWLGLEAVRPDSSDHLNNNSNNSQDKNSKSDNHTNNSNNSTGSNNSSSSSSGTIEGISFCDISLTAVYFSERITTFEACLRKCAVFPSAWSLPPKLKQSLWMSIQSFVWMTWIDTLLGCIVGYYMYMNAKELVLVIEQFCHNAQQSVIIDTLEWFNHSPGGVKLNNVITTKIGTGLRMSVNTYHTVLIDTKMLHLPVANLVACVGVLGITAQLVVIVDVFRVVTLHIAAIHRVLSFCHQLQLQLLYSLYLLFAGQKKNILRQRVDTCEYDKHQQLFGVVFFAIAIFCFPSFAAYYYLFAFAQLGVVMIQYVLWSAMIAIKEFPLYALHIFIWQPKMMTNGVQFKIVDTAATVVAKNNTAFKYDTADTGSMSPGRSQLSVGTEDSIISGSLSPKSSVVINNRSPKVKVKGILKSKDSNNRMSMYDKEVQPDDESDRSSNKGSHQVHFDMDVDDATTAAPQSRDKQSNGRSESSKPVELYSSDSTLSIVTPHLKSETLEDINLSSLSFGRSSVLIPSLPFRSEETSPLRRQPPSVLGNNEISNHTITKVENSNNAVYLSLIPRRWSLIEIFVGYSLYLRYIVAERGFTVRVLRGIFLGRPALDIQLIHATASLAHKKAVKEQVDISNAFKMAVVGRGNRDTRAQRSGQRGTLNEVYLSAYDCFNKNGARSTMKNRKNVTNNKSSSGSSTSDDNVLDLGPNPMDYINIYDLPAEGYPMKITFWDTIRLAQSNIDEMDADEEDSSEVGGSNPGRGTMKRVNNHQLSLSKLLLYLVLITATINLVLTSFGAVIFLGSFLPSSWQMKLVSLYGHAGKVSVSLSESSITQSINNNTLIESTLNKPAWNSTAPLSNSMSQTTTSHFLNQLSAP